MIEKIQQYLIKGKIKLALEALAQSSQEPVHAALRTEAIHLLSRLVSAEEKLLQGLIGFEESERVENQIRLAAIKLLDKYQRAATTPSDIEEQAAELARPTRQYKLVGKWFCTFFDPDIRRQTRIFWTVKADHTYQIEIQDEQHRILTQVSGKWALDKNIYTEVDEKGQSGKGLVEWIDADNIIFTILSAASKKLHHLKRIYKRLHT